MLSTGKKYTSKRGKKIQRIEFLYVSQITTKNNKDEDKKLHKNKIKQNRTLYTENRTTDEEIQR